VTLPLERAQPLDLTLERLFELADQLPLLRQPGAHLQLGLGPRRQFSLGPRPLALRRLMLLASGFLLLGCLQSAALHLAPLLARPELPRGSVRQPFGGQGEISVEFAELEPDVAQLAGDIGHRRAAPCPRRYRAARVP
jgi:hypothetical protein